MKTQTKVLIVTDMLIDFIDGSLGSEAAQAIVENVKRKIAHYKVSGWKIVYLSDFHPADEYLNTIEGKHLPVAHAVPNTPGIEIYPGLYMEGAPIFFKSGFGSFDMIEYLKEVDNAYTLLEVEIIGLCTEICVTAAALLIRSALLKVKVTVDEGCCAGLSPEGHAHGLAVLRACMVNIVNEYAK